MGFLKAILFVLLGYYLLKLVLRLFAPKILGYAAKKTEAHFRERFGEFSQFDPQQPQFDSDGISRNKKHPRKNKSSEKVGEYIDFEEID